MRILRAMAVAFSTYSKIPMPQVKFSEDNLRYSLCFFPLIGLVIGLAEVFWLQLAWFVGLGEALRGAVACLIPLGISGGIHMDGLMDTADAMASWQTKERRLEILKDSHTGAFAVMGCAGYLLVQYAAFCALPAGKAIWALVPSFVLSRAMSALFLVTLKGARPNGMLHLFQTSAQTRAVRWAMGLTALASACALLCVQWRVGGVILCACALVAFAYQRRAYRYFGGITGDLAGFYLQATELAYLVCLALLWGRL